MRPTVLALAALSVAVPAAPAATQALAGAGISGGQAFAGAASGRVTVHHGATRYDRVMQGDPDGRRRHRNRRNEGFGDVYSDLRDSYDINRVWASDSYNDWWHDRPDRAFPRWMQSNQECQRQYWSGSGWRC